MKKKIEFDIIVIGGGHAGVEAAFSGVQMNCNVLLITNNINTIGTLSCNPSIGGIGKSQLVKEIDAMGGLMAINSDYSGINFKILNSRKGPAVRSTRSQIDRDLYQKNILYFLKKKKKLKIFQSEIKSLIIKKNQVFGVKTKENIKFYGTTVILCTGTFLGAKMYVGSKTYLGGRAEENLSSNLSKELKEFPFRIGRLKTGTPPRIMKDSINFNNLEKQYSDDPLPIFSFLGKTSYHPKQVPCYITYTNITTHQIIANNLKLSPMYNGKIKSLGPRYCPSIEDKIINFPERNRHQIFLEPEGLNSKIFYPNGLSTSLPSVLQEKILKSIKGLENVKIQKNGYAVEYDYFDPRDLKMNLESKFIKNLFFSGQINGTTGYEEAAAQGFLAGLNASLLVLNKDPWIPNRDQAYLGVLIDDLCNKGIASEPYRMFTSRSEYRLLLRESNADLRLTEIGRKLGVVKDYQWKIFSKKKEILHKEIENLKNIKISVSHKNITYLNKFLKSKLKNSKKAIDLLLRPEISYSILFKFLNPFNEIKNQNKEIYEELETQIKYQGYILKQKKEIKKYHRFKNIPLSLNYNYSKINGLSREAINKLNKYKPLSLSQAAQIPGITPATISILLVFLRKSFF